MFTAKADANMIIRHKLISLKNKKKDQSTDIVLFVEQVKPMVQNSMPYFQACFIKPFRQEMTH